MATNLAIDSGLLNEALQIGGEKSKKETVTQALIEYVQRRKQAEFSTSSGRSSSIRSMTTSGSAAVRRTS